MKGTLALAAGLVAWSGMAAAQSGAPPVITDAEIAAIVVAANQADADLGAFAAAHATDSAVKAFANTMVRDHRAVNEQAIALVTRLGVKPVENGASRSLIAAGVAARERLLGKAGVEFDRAYIDHEISYHEAVIKALDETLVPNARNADLKQAIEAVRPALQAHLEHARRIQAARR